MNPDYQNRLEREIERQLKSLPELEAPPSLVPRVMRALEARAHAAWYQRPWQTWPHGLKTASLAGMVTLFAALCFVAWAAPGTKVISGLISQFDTFFGSFVALHDLVHLLRNVPVMKSCPAP